MVNDEDHTNKCLRLLDVSLVFQGNAEKNVVQEDTFNVYLCIFFKTYGGILIYLSRSILLDGNVFCNSDLACCRRLNQI